MKSLKISLVLLSALLLFASCGGNNETETDRPESGTESNTESRETTPDTDSDTMEETDPITDTPMTDDNTVDNGDTETDTDETNTNTVARTRKMRAAAKKQAEAMVDKVQSALDLYLR